MNFFPVTTAVSLVSLALVASAASCLSAKEVRVAPVASPSEKQAAPSPIYPVPQKSTWTGKQLSVKGLAPVAGKKSDADALRVIKESAPVGDLAVRLGNQDEAGFATKAAGIPDKVGAYKLIIEPSGITIIGRDAVGQYYGAQSLSQLIKATEKGISLPEGEILDYPDVAFRGTVEGFYGKPWGYEDRISQFKFYGKYKLNTYIYGPKDDPFHGFSNRWREPYPEAEAKKMTELVKEAKRNKVNFVWAVHPGRDIKWGEADNLAALKKFEMMYDLGVRSFGVFFDDIGGEGAKAEGQVEFLNYLNREFIAKKPDVTPLVMCPTEYNKGWANKQRGTYLDILGDKLDKNIDIMWTGNSVVSDITQEGLDWVNERIKRPAYIWWNFPVSDFVRHALLLGRIYGLEKGTEGAMSAFTSNPMDKPEASKIGLFGIADFTWNQDGFDSTTSWKEGIKRLFPKCSAAMQTMANHNSDHGPNGHGYRREESVEIAPMIEEFKASLAGKNPTDSAAFAALVKEFQAIAKAPKEIASGSHDNPALLLEMKPWLFGFEKLGTAGSNALKCVQVGGGEKAMSELFRLHHDASEALAQIDTMGKIYAEETNAKSGNSWQSPVKVGTLVMRPFVEFLLNEYNGALYSQLSGAPLKKKKPYCSTTSLGGVEKMLDNDPSTFFYAKEILKVGDYFGVDLGSVQDIASVNLLMGRQDGDSDGVHKGQLEISKDGRTWEPLMPETAGLTVKYAGKGKKGRYVRYRATVAGIPGGKPDVWTAIREFGVNESEVSKTLSNVEALANLQMKREEKEISLAPLLEMVKLAPKQYFGLLLADAPFIESVELDLKRPLEGWGKLESSLDGKTWTEIPVKKAGDKLKAEVNSPIKALRVINSSGGAQECNLSEFKLLFPKNGAGVTQGALDENLMTCVDVRLGEAEPVAIPNSLPKVQGVKVVSNGVPSEVLVCDALGVWKPLGKIKGEPVKAFSLKGVKQPVKSLGFKGEKGDILHVFEVIWR